MCARAENRGVTLIELVVFIVLVGVAMAGIFSVYNRMIASSADPQVRKQVLAAAESLLEEVMLMPFTFCDPDDAQAATATSNAVAPTGCFSLAGVEVIGAEAGETRGGATPFDNVSDYNGAPLGTGISDLTGTPVTGLEAYVATISVAETGIGTGLNAIASTESLRISVTVTHPNGTSVTLEGYRTRYAPRSLP